MKKKIFYYISLVVLIFMAVSLYSTDFTSIYSLPSSFYVNLDEIEDSNKQNKFGQFVTLEVGDETLVSNLKANERVVVFKLFGFIPVRKIVAKIFPEEEVYVGGNPIGISLNAQCGIVVSQSNFGKENKTVASKVLKEGDVIYKINGEEVNTLDDITTQIERSEGGKICIEFYRNDKLCKANVNATKDVNENYKLGITVKDDVSGIGTLTYVNSKTAQFGALGHPICKNAESIELAEGSIYDCKLLGIEKGAINNPGQLKGVFVEGKNIKGEIKTSNNFGVYGKLDDFSIIDTNKVAMLGGRLSVSPGKAKIISSISGIREEYEIEIIRAYSQNTEKDKSFVFRVTDERLLELTGGIVQGMSGSPIIQNGKIIGAITHVFTSDPSKGYGVYTDWMILNNLDN